MGNGRVKKNRIERQIVWGDLDALGIVFYPRYYEWIDACGHLFFDTIGLNLGDLWHQRSLQFGLVKTACRYLKPGRYYDHIRITTFIEGLARKTVDLKHVIENRDTGEIMVEGSEKRICLEVSDPLNFRATNIPEDVYAVFKEAKGD